MRRFCSSEEVETARLSPWQHKAVAGAVGILEAIFGQGYDPQHSFVVLIEENDTPDDAVPLVGYSMGAKLESAWRLEGCLVGLTLWGNTGDGVTWVCPERPGYAPQIQDLLRREL